MRRGRLAPATLSRCDFGPPWGRVALTQALPARLALPAGRGRRKRVAASPPSSQPLPAFGLLRRRFGCRADTMNQLILCTLLLLALGELAGACPAGCQCQDPKTILCAARRGQTVPRGLPPNTLSLYVFENGITMLSEDSFAGLPALQLLDLSQNKIASIQKNIFQPLTELVNLDLSSNQLQEITNETFHGLRLLERLYLQRNRIQHIHAAAFDTLENLLELKLQNNQLWAVPPLNLPNLLLLDISWNKIPAIAPGAFHAVNIESLKIAGLGLTSLNEELFQAQNNLHELDVSDNLLERVPAVLRRLGSLTKLSLAGNARISQLLAEDFHNLHNLQELDISNLNINTIPRDFSSFFPRLRAVTASGNPFNCICQMSWLVQWVNASSVVLRRPEETRCHFLTCHLGAQNHLECLCPEGFAGAYCQAEVKGTTPSPATQAPPPGRRISITQVSSTSLKVDLQNYVQSKVQLKGIRLSYRNLSGPDKRPVMLRLPASLSEYTVRALKPNCTYRVCIGPLGEKVSKEEHCAEAQTLPVSHQQHSPVTQSKDSNLTLMIVPALAAVLLLVVVVTAGTYYRRHRRAKAHAGARADASPLELEGVKACLENGDLSSHGRKVPEAAMLSGGSECEVPLMQSHYPSNNNTPGLKPSYF
ncbi:PREDICTED: vasorin [Nipponia nippon]|uniref:vasorin n=1 Tax=Nipponia nippon TaxID=128390 RepID=UPI0005108323|nr:PREDICTED: vasorin [Nipponia nippon]